MSGERGTTAGAVIHDGVRAKIIERPQTGGTHYQLPIQPVDYIVENGLGYLEGNVVKYVTRHRAKNGLEDIEKAIDYCNMIKEKVYGIPRA